MNIEFFQNSNEWDCTNVEPSDKIPKISQKREIKKIFSVEIGSKRNYFPDDIRKKIKTHFHAYLIAQFNWLLTESRWSKDLRIVKFQKDLTKKLSIGFNKNLLQRIMKDIFSDDISKKYTTLKPTHNKDIVEQVENDPEFTSFLQSTYFDQFNFYLQSAKFREDIINIRKANGSMYERLFIENARHFLNYYSTFKPNKEKKKMSCCVIT